MRLAGFRLFYSMIMFQGEAAAVIDYSTFYDVSSSFAKDLQSVGALSLLSIGPFRLFGSI